jgi:hypothetical protein
MRFFMLDTPSANDLKLPRMNAFLLVWKKTHNADVILTSTVHLLRSVIPEAGEKRRAAPPNE